MKIGVLGLGSIGMRHYNNLKDMGHDVIGYDPLQQRDVKFPCEIFERCDAVVSATPSINHCADIRAAVERGKHIFVEKPIATDLNGLEELLSQARDKNLVVFTGYNLRFHAVVVRIKEWLDQGLIGNPLWASFSCGQVATKPAYLRDGVILNWSHEIDLALYLLGLAKVTHASARLTIREDDDMADILMRHDNGVRNYIHLDYVSNPEIRGNIISGDDGYIAADLVTRQAVLLKRRNWMERSFAAEDSFDRNYIDEMKAFLARVAGEKTRGATGEDGLAALKICLDARAKARVP